MASLKVRNSLSVGRLADGSQLREARCEGRDVALLLRNRLIEWLGVFERVCPRV